MTWASYREKRPYICVQVSRLSFRVFITFYPYPEELEIVSTVTPQFYTILSSHLRPHSYQDHVTGPIIQ